MTGPAPAVAAVRVAVRRALVAGRGDASDDDRADVGSSLVLVACSGGPDSLALAAAAAFEGPRAGVRVGAVVVDHGLQAGSAEVAAGAAATCRDLGLAPVLTVRVDVAPDGTGPEAAARTARYAALKEAAHSTGAQAVLLGHTRDDQAESVLLGLARGSGARSLAGMAPVRGLLRRPLLDLDRATVHASLGALGLTGWLDPTNDDPALARSRARRRVLPVLEAELGPGVAAALARSADLLRDDADALDALAADLLAAARRPPTTPTPPLVANGGHSAPEGAIDDQKTGDEVALDLAMLAAAPAAVRTRVLRAAAILVGSPAGALSRVQVLAVDALVTQWKGQGPVHLAGGVEARRTAGTLAVRSV